MAEKKKDERLRDWTFEVYPESAPENWRSIINSLHVPWVCSPLHDKDIYEDGENKGKPKKPHYHCAVIYEGKKSYEQVKSSITDPLNQPRPEPIHNLRSMIRYFIHRDDPDKYQYYLGDMITYGGVDVNKYFLDSAGKYEALHEMMQFVVDNEITEYSVFSLKLYDCHRADLFPYLADCCAFFMCQFIKSYRHNPAAVEALFSPDVVLDVPQDDKKEDPK